jgi:hypothetical protein
MINPSGCTPPQVAFLETNGVDSLFVINRLVDVVFLLDMGLQFCLSYQAFDPTLMLSDMPRILAPLPPHRVPLEDRSTARRWRARVGSRMLTRSRGTT